MKEQWKIIKDYSNYAVSNKGRIKKVIKTTNRSKVGCILKGSFDSRGYIRVRLYENGNGKWKQYRIHRLVAHAFLGECPVNKEVNHIDGNKLNNYIDNLEYVTQSENMKHAMKNGLMYSKLTESQILKIRKLYQTKKYSQVKLGKMFSVVQQHISEIVNKKVWRHI